MKLFYTLAILFFGQNLFFAQNDEKMISSVNEELKTMDTILNLDQWKTKASTFSDLKTAYANSWIPKYYLAYCYVQASYVEPSEKLKDSYIDLAEAELIEVETACKEKDVIYVLKALIANGRLAVDPNKRWREYGKIFEENIKLAKEVNPSNPHPYYLKGAALFYTPKAFGGGMKIAKPQFEKANELYNSMTTWNAETPYWGKGANSYFLAECSK